MAQRRIPGIERPHINITVIERQQGKTEFALKRQARDLAPEDRSSAAQNFWHRIARDLAPLAVDALGHDSSLHIIGKCPETLGSNRITRLGFICVAHERDQHGSS